jgi:hypothetical protein
MSPVQGMTQLGESRLAQGGSVVVEMDRDNEAGKVATRSDRQGAIAAQAGRTFEDAVDGVLPAIGAIVDRVRTAAGATEEITVQFGVKMSADVGAIIARTSGEANFSISVRWTRSG